MLQPLRIIQVVNVRWFNATAWYGLFLARLLRDAGHKVLALVPAGTECCERAQAMGLDTLTPDLNTASPLRLAASLKALRGIMRDFSPQVVNCHRGEGFLLWGLLRAMGHDFALIRTRGDQRPPKNNVPNRLLHRRADALIATNSRTAHALAGLGVPNERITTILGGVDTSVYSFDAPGRERVRREFGFTPEHVVLGLLGRFDRVKGQIELLRALAGLRARNAALEASLRLILMGFTTSMKQEEVEAAIRELKLEDVVHITGKRSDVPACISAFDLGVIASQGSEAIARAAFEIMACRVPLVGTDVGVMPDLLEPEALAPTGDASALENLLERAAAPSFRATLRERQAGRISELDSRGFLYRTLAVYHKALQRRGLSRLI